MWENHIESNVNLIGARAGESYFLWRKFPPLQQHHVDCYQLVLELDEFVEVGSDARMSGEISSALRRYEKERMRRVSIVHLASRTASKLLSDYKPYLDFGYGTSSYLSSVRIKTPAIHIARVLLQLLLPRFMTWMITGFGFVISTEKHK